jgi:hypothetical protein
MPKLNVRFRISTLSSSIAQLLGQNGSSSKGKKRLHWLILICQSELNGRFRFSMSKGGSALQAFYPGHFLMVPEIVFAVSFSFLLP